MKNMTKIIITMALMLVASLLIAPVSASDTGQDKDIEEWDIDYWDIDYWDINNWGINDWDIDEWQTGVFGKGYWFLKDEAAEDGYHWWHFGDAGDIPFVLADGRTGVFGKGYWFVRDPATGDVDEVWGFGDAGDIPFVLADGRTGVFGKGHWFVMDPATGGVDEVWGFGDTGDRPFVLADGRTGVFGKGYWFVMDPATGDVDEVWGFGDTGDIPFVLADGKTGVFGKGHWFVRDPVNGGVDESWDFGDAGDKPFVVQDLPPPEPALITAIVPIEDSVAVSYGTSKDDAIATLNAETAYEGVVADADNVVLEIENWASGTYAPEATGDHTFTGQATAPVGYAFADGVDTTVAATVTVGDRPDDKSVNQIVPESTSVDRHTPKEDIDFPAQAVVRAGTTWYTLDVEWDDESTPAYNSDVPGVYVFAGELKNLPAYVTNPDNLKAEYTVTVRDTEIPGTVYVRTYQEFQRAIDNEAERIILERDITLERRERIRHDLKVLDLRGFTITLADGTRAGPLSFEGDGTTVKNGKIVGDVTWWDLKDCFGDCSEDTWPYGPDAQRKWETWQYEPKVMVSGDGVTFDNIVFEVDFADWYQTQKDKTARDLTIRDCKLYGVSLFNSDVSITNTEVYNRIGIEHDDAELNEVEYKINNKLIVGKSAEPTSNYVGEIKQQPSVGIVYVNSDATLIDNIWNAGRARLDVVVVNVDGEEQDLVKPVTVDYDYATGMFVGKSLKYYGDYSQAEPRLIGARIISDKYAFVWWALNYHKAELVTSGDIVVTSGEGRGGLMVVGTDHRDYEGSDDSRIFEGGKIIGTGTFTGAPVYIGKPTEGYAKEAGYPGAAGLTINSKKPWCINRTGYNDIKVIVIVRDKHGKITGIDEVVVPGGSWPDDKMLDCQACKKDADRLLIDGQIFVSPAYIFTPANDYIGCDGCCTGSSYSPFAHLKDSVRFGTLTFDKIQLWGDFDIVRSRTVTFDEIKVMCGNIRRIGTEKNISGTHEDCVGWPDFSEGGTLTGGTITSDTKQNNTLVFGDGLKVHNVVLDRTLYNVILEYAWLEDVDMYVGDGNRNDKRYVCEHVCGGSGKYNATLEGDIFVWYENMATISNSMFSGQTRIVTKDNAALTLANNVDNRGELIFEPEAGLYFDNADFDWVDIRDAITVDIRESGGRAYIDIEFSPFAAYWSFENWKLDAEFTADDRIISKKYRISWYPQAQKVESPYETRWFNWYIDYRDPEEYEWSIVRGAYLIGDILGVGHKEYPDPFPEPGPKLKEQDTITLRLEAGAPELPGEKVTFELSGRLVGINCCTRVLIEFDTATEVITLDPKFACKDFNLRQAFEDLKEKHPVSPLRKDIPWLPGWEWDKTTQYNGWIVFPKAWIVNNTPD